MQKHSYHRDGPYVIAIMITMGSPHWGPNLNAILGIIKIVTILFIHPYILSVELWFPNNRCHTHNSPFEIFQVCKKSNSQIFDWKLTFFGSRSKFLILNPVWRFWNCRNFCEIQKLGWRSSSDEDVKVWLNIILDHSWLFTKQKMKISRKKIEKFQFLFYHLGSHNYITGDITGLIEPIIHLTIWFLKNSGTSAKSEQGKIQYRTR